MEAARKYVANGRRWVVDIDLEKFFDRVNHDILMALVRRKVGDSRGLTLIRRYLKGGIMDGGLNRHGWKARRKAGRSLRLLSNIF